ncbi:MAG: AraC family transcriptional regulator [Bythopirellula sp.]
MNDSTDHTLPTQQPLSQHRMFQSQNFEDVSERLSDFYSGTDVTIRPAQPSDQFAHELFAVPFGRIAITSLVWPFGVCAEAPLMKDTFDFCTSIVGKCQVSVGKVEFVSDTQHGFVLSPRSPMRIRANARHAYLNAKIPRRLIECQFTAVTGREIVDPLDFTPAMSVDSARLAGVWALVRLMASEAERDGTSFLTSPIVCERFCETLLTSFLYAQPHNYSKWLESETKPGPPRYVRLVEEYLEAQCAKAISTPDLAEVVGVPVSTLYAGFRRYRECTPLQFLTDLRLRRVRDALLAAPIDTKVGDIAMCFGFTHMGRFSKLYAKTFGELPSGTQRRDR